MSKHEKLCEKAKEAIDEVFADRSVSPLDTLESLYDLTSEINFKIKSIEYDLERTKSD